MSFFQDFPLPENPPRGRTVRFVPPPWAGPPRYELPVLVHIGQFLHHGPHRVLAVKSSQVFSTGCTFDVSWIIRRADESDEDWAILNSAFFRRGVGSRPGEESLDALLLFGVQLPDGSRASAGARVGDAFMDPSKMPEAPFLTFQGVGGNGSDDEMAGSGTLWLWPLPPEGELQLVAQWKEFGIEESSLALDGGGLRAAALGAQPFWSPEQNPSAVPPDSPV